MVPALAGEHADSHPIEKSGARRLRRRGFAVSIEPDHAGRAATAAAYSTKRRIAVARQDQRNPALTLTVAHAFGDRPRDGERRRDLRQEFIGQRDDVRSRRVALPREQRVDGPPQVFGAKSHSSSMMTRIVWRKQRAYVHAGLTRAAASTPGRCARSGSRRRSTLQPSVGIRYRVESASIECKQ